MQLSASACQLSTNPTLKGWGVVDSKQSINLAHRGRTVSGQIFADSSTVNCQTQLSALTEGDCR
jgi:hypothetical protein